MTPRTAGPALLIALAIHVAATAQTTSDWPRWRGAAFDGTAQSTQPVLSRPFDLQIRWKRTLGAGYSGIVVAGGHAVTMFSDAGTDFLASLSSKTGNEEWRVPVGEAFPARDGSAGGPVSTPAIDGGTVFGLGPHGLLVAVALDSGKVLWKVDLTKSLGAETPHWGFTTSPLVTDGLVILVTGGERGAVTAFEARTGAVAWRSGSDSASYQSPLLATIDGQQRVLAAGDRYLFAVDPRDGRIVWQYEHGGRGFFGRIINPVVSGSNRLLLTYRPDESVMLRTAPQPAVLWSSRDLKLSYVTPVAYGPLLFGYSGAFLSCLDADTGALHWRSRAPGDGFPILVDNHLIVLTKQGSLSVAEANKQGYREKQSLELFSRLVWTPPAFAEGRIFARDSYAEAAAVDVVPKVRDTTTTLAEAPHRGVVPDSDFARWVADVHGKPDAAQKVATFIESQPRFPIIERDRYAHFIYTGPANDIAIKGDLLAAGEELPMHRIAGTDTFYASFELRSDARLSYQFVRNLNDAVADPRNPHTAESLNLPGPASLLLMPAASKPVSNADSAVLRGRVEQITMSNETVRSEHLTWGGKRQIDVYLPPEYDAAPDRRYRTLYVLYGEEMRRGGLPALLEKEFGRGLPPMIAVFVYSTSAYEYARTFRAAHLQMLTGDVVKLIDAKFRTVAHRRQRILLGADEAGFAAIETGLRRPDMFGNVVAHSIFALTGGDKELLSLVDAAAPAGQRFFLDAGVYDPRRASDMLNVHAFTKQLAARLATRKFDVHWQERSDGSVVALWLERSIEILRSWSDSDSR